MEYAHNSLVSLGYQPPFFDFYEDEVAVPSVRANLRCSVEAGPLTLMCSSLQSQKQANHHRAPAPSYRGDQKVWLSSKDLPLHVEAKNLAPRIVGPFKVERMGNPVAVRLRLPASLKVDPNFYVSRVKPVLESELAPPSTPPPLPRIHGPTFTVRCILDVCQHGRGLTNLADREGYSPEERL